jgi:hypothetical protein
MVVAINVRGKKRERKQIGSGSLRQLGGRGLWGRLSCTIFDESPLGEGLSKQGLSTGATMGLLIFLSDLGESLRMTSSPDIFVKTASAQLSP